MDLFVPWHALRRAPVAVFNLVQIAPEGVWDSQPDPERFSFREDIAHLAEIEHYFLKRIQKIAGSPGCQLESIDIEGLPDVAHYQEFDPSDSAKRWQESRQETIQYCDKLSQEVLVQVGIHPEFGEMSIQLVLQYMSQHDMYHLEHMLALTRETVESLA